MHTGQAHLVAITLKVSTAVFSALINIEPLIEKENRWGFQTHLQKSIVIPIITPLLLLEICDISMDLAKTNSACQFERQFSENLLFYEEFSIRG